MFFVYLLQSKKDLKYYIGQTEDLETRVKTHNSGLVRSTRHRTPFRLVGYEEYSTREEARWRERQLKNSAHQRKMFIKKLNIPG